MSFYTKNNLIEDRNYAWQYFSTHAEQRLKTFNFFIMIMSLLVGAIFTLIKLEHVMFIIISALLMSFFSFIFWKLDQRNKELINHAQETLKKIEKKGSIKLFIEEEKKTNLEKEKNESFFFNRHYSYSDSFNSVFKLFGLGGITTVILILVYEYLILTKKDTINVNTTLYESLFINNYLVYTFIGLFIYIWILLYFFYRNKPYYKNFIISFILSIIATSSIHVLSFDKLLSLKIDKVNLSYKAVESKKELQHDLKILNKITLYFDRGEITIKENLSENNSFYLTHSSNINDTTNLIQSLNKANTYYIKISAFASLEKVVKSNKIIDNYQISIARADSTKEYILNLLINKNFPVNQVKFDVYGTSNQNINNNFHSANRKAEIEVYIIK